MKIAFLSLYMGHVPRGVETFVFEVANRLAKKHEVTVYQGGPTLKGAVYKTVEVTTEIDWNQKDSRGTLLKLFLIDYWSLLLKKFTLATLKLFDSSVDIVFPTNGGWQSVLIRLWSMVKGIPMVIAGQSGPGVDDRINLLCRPNTFISLTDYQSQWAKRNGFGVPVIKIPNGVDLGVFNPKITPAKVDLPKPLIVCVAALEPGKRVDLTIKAVSRLKKGSLLIMGAGDGKKALEALASELLPHRFKIIQVTHDAIPGYYNAADVVTMTPQTSESFGIVYVEAMACNKPVVATNDPIRKEIIGKAGLLVDPENTQEYTAALEKALSKSWGDIPRKQAEKYSWDTIANQYEDLFESLLKKEK